MDQDTPVVLMWTGGWDSTFRLLQLLLQLRVPVAPLYMLDDTRASAPIEIRTMDGIRAALAEQHPHTRDLLRPTTVVPVRDLAPDPKVQRAFDRLAVKHAIGSQYGWLARYYRQRGVPGIEVACEHTPHGASGVLIVRHIAAQSPQGYNTFLVNPNDPDPDIDTVFGGFAFPLIETTREDMLDFARANDWVSLMGRTWFCHRPTRNAEPCGLCNPCRANIEEGFGWRISRRRRALSAVYRYTLLPVRKGARRVLLHLRAMSSARGS
jgi:hypothetical protein